MKRLGMMVLTVLAVLGISTGDARAWVTMTAVSTDSIYMSWSDATYEIKYLIEDVDGNALTDSIAMNSTGWGIGGLKPNTKYVWGRKAVGGNPIYTQVTYDSAYTKAATPGKPTLTFPAKNRAKLVLSPSGNPPYTQFAVQDSITGKYVYPISGVDTLGTTPCWGTYNDFGRTYGDTVAVKSGQKYAFRVKARSGRADTTYRAIAEYYLTQADTSLGPELIVNGDFSLWSGAADPNNLPSSWLRHGTATTTEMVQNSNGTAHFLAAASAVHGIRQALTVSQGKSYRAALTSQRTSGALELIMSNDRVFGITSSGLQSKVYRYRTTDYYVLVRTNSTSSTDIAIDNFSVKEYSVRDFSRYHHRGYPYAAPEWVTVGNVSCMDFNGYSGGLNTGANYIGTGKLALEFVAVVDSLGGGSTGRIYGNGRFRVYVATGNTIKVTSDSITVATSADSAFVFGRAFHCWVLRDSTAADPGAVTIYINNVLSGATNQPSGTPTTTGAENVYIGNNSVGNRGFNGRLGRLIVFPEIPDATFRAKEISDWSRFYGIN